MLMLEHLDHLAETAATAISNIKFDKIVVWDGANGGGKPGEGGGSGTSRFLQSLAGSLPPTLQMMKDIGGIEMPEFLGKLVTEREEEAAPTVVPEVVAESEEAVADIESDAVDDTGGSA